MIRALCAVLVIFSLLHLQLGNFEHKYLLAWNSAYAADATTSIVGTPTAKATSSASGTYIENPNTKNDSGRFGVKPEDMDLSGAAGFVDVLVMVAVGLVGRGLLMCNGTFWQADVMAYVAGAVMFIAGEVMAFMKFNKAQKQLGEEVEWKKGLTGSQREALIKMRQTLEEMKGAAKTKYTMQLSAATAFTLAAGIAVGKYVMLQSLRTSCLSADAAGAASVYLSSVCGPAAAAAGQKIAAYAATDGLPTPSTGADLKTQTIENTSGVASAKCPTGAGICTASTVNERMSWVVCTKLNSLVKTNFLDNSWSSYFSSIYKNKVATPITFASIDRYLDEALPFTNVNTCSKERIFNSTPTSISERPVVASTESEGIAQQFMDLIVSRAHAGGGMIGMLGLGAGAVVMLSGLVMTQSYLVDQWIHGPLGRSIVFGITAGLAVAASMMTKGIINKIEERIKKIDEILATAGNADLPYLANVSVSIDSPYAISENIPLADIKAIDANARRYPCVSNPAVPTAGDPGTVQTTSNGCASISALLAKNPKLDGKSVGFDLKTLGSEFNAAATSAAAIADSIQGADSVSGATMNSAQALGGKLAFAQNGLKKLQNRVNEDLKKQGKKPVDFVGMNKELLGKMRDGVSQDLKKQNLTAAQALGKLGASPLTSEESKAAATTSSKTGLSYEGGASAYEQAPASMAIDDLANSAATASASESESLEELAKGIDLKKVDETQGNQIIDKPEASIFNIISVRYLKSGLSRLGVLSKTALPVGTPAVKKDESQKTTEQKK